MGIPGGPGLPFRAQRGVPGAESEGRARASREFAGALRPSRTSRLPPPGVSPGLSGPARLSRAYADETSVASGVRRAHRLGPSV